MTVLGKKDTNVFGSNMKYLLGPKSWNGAVGLFNNSKREKLCLIYKADDLFNQ